MIFQILQKIFSKPLFYRGGFKSSMDIQEASLILGCRRVADKEKIMKRYRDVMKMNHPDMGGSLYIASKINEAKQILLRSKNICLPCYSISYYNHKSLGNIVCIPLSK